VIYAEWQVEKGRGKDKPTRIMPRLTAAEEKIIHRRHGYSFWRLCWKTTGQTSSVEEVASPCARWCWEMGLVSLHRRINLFRVRGPFSGTAATCVGATPFFF
jgi:hypothetical protein